MSLGDTRLFSAFNDGRSFESTSFVWHKGVFPFFQASFKQFSPAVCKLKRVCGAVIVSDVDWFSFNIVVEDASVCTVVEERDSVDTLEFILCHLCL